MHMSATAELYSGCVFLSILSKSFPKRPQNSHPQQENKKGAAPLPNVFNLSTKCFGLVFSVVKLIGRGALKS